MKKYKLHEKTIMRLILLLTIAIFASINILFIQLDSQYDMSIDLSDVQYYDFSQQSLDICNSLTNNTEIIVISSEIEYPEMFREMLYKYNKLSKNITLTFMDPAQNPVFIEYYTKLGYDVTQNSILIDGNNRIKLIPYESMLVYEGETPIGINLEQQVSSALLYVNQEEVMTAVITSGHGENTSDSLEELLINNNFSIETKNLSVELLGKPDLLIVASPNTDFTPYEVEQLTQYLNDGGKFLIFAEATSSQMPNLNSLTNSWGMQFSNTVVFESKGYIAGNRANIVPMYTSHKINEYFISHSRYVISPFTQAIALNQEQKGVNVEPILVSTQDSYAKNDLQYQSTDKNQEDTTGPFVTAVIAEKPLTSGDDSTRILMIGSSNIYSDEFMNSAGYANSIFISKALKYMLQYSDSISITPKIINDRSIVMQADTLRLFAILLVIVLPLFVIAVGIFVFRKRRHL